MLSMLNQQTRPEIVPDEARGDSPLEIAKKRTPLWKPSVDWIRLFCFWLRAIDAILDPILVPDNSSPSQKPFASKMTLLS